MLWKFDRPPETETLLGLVSYGDLDADLVDAEDSIADQAIAKPQWRILPLDRRSRPAARFRRWLRIGALRRLRARVSRLDVA